MYRMQWLSCLALTLALITHSAPTSRSTKAMHQQLEQLLGDLDVTLRRVNNYETSKLSMMLRFKFYLPKKVTELKHLQCLVGELKPLEDVLNIAQNKEDTSELISNINVTALELKGSETTFTCDYDEKTSTIVEFLSKWIAFCQSVISTLT
ncbi:interleukin-2 [Echinops telfairi]|uniref:Interleukin-2 n=1 Tax=Echinops telfairi TaxID=9371 RepID=A0ABM0J062_ECHTE|nr:interleukin-2 [Echinops telfairi]